MHKPITELRILELTEQKVTVVLNSGTVIILEYCESLT